MVEVFPSREAALLSGIGYLTMHGQVSVYSLEIDHEMEIIADSAIIHKVDVYTLREDRWLGVSEYNGRFQLWIIHPKSGFCQRV